MYEYGSWTIKKAEWQRIDAFELWCWRRLWESLGLQGDPTSPSKRKAVLNIHRKDWCWGWNSNTLATWCEALSHWKRPWCQERLKVGGEGDDRGWDGWIASPTWWTWVWVNSRSWWWTGRPGVLQSMGSQKVRHNWATELKPLNFHCVSLSSICYYTISWRDLKKYIWIRLTPCLKSCIVSSHTWNKIQSPYFNLAWPLISPPSPGSFLLVNFNSAIRGLFLVLCHTELILPH